MTFSVQFAFTNNAIQQIQTVLKVLPKRLRNGAMRSAGRKAAQVVRTTIRPLVPVSKRDYRQQGPTQSATTGQGSYMHLRDGIISVVRTYNNAIYMAVGPRTRAKLNHAHLVEAGTRERFTRHSTKADRYITVGQKRIKARAKSGKRYYTNMPIKRSLGSMPDAAKLKGGTAQKRGRMRAYRYMERGWQSAEPRVYQIIQTELTNALANIGTTITP